MSRCTNAVASAAGRLSAPPYASRSSAPEPSDGLRWRRSIQSIIFARPLRPEPLVEVVRLREEARPGRPVARREAAVEAAGPALDQREVARAATAEARPRHARERPHEPAQLGDVAEVLPERGHARRAGAARRAEREDRGERRRRLRREALPGRQRLLSLRPRPRDAEPRRTGRPVRLQGQRRHDPEVAAAAAATRPEEVLVRVGVQVPYAPVGGHDARREQVVAREPEAPPGQAMPAAEGEAADANRRAGPGRDRHAPPGERALHVDQLRARADRRAAARHPHSPQLRQVEHHAVAGARVARVAVAARACHHPHVEAIGPAHRRRHVCRVLHVDDRVGPKPLEAAVVDDPRRCRAARAPFP